MSIQNLVTKDEKFNLKNRTSHRYRKLKDIFLRFEKGLKFKSYQI